MKRGEIWWANLQPPTGSGPGYRRPVVIIQANAFNESRISTVVVAVITSNIDLAKSPGNVRLSRKDSALSKTSVVNVSQIATIGRAILSHRVGRLPNVVMEKVDQGLRLVLGL